MKQDAKGQMRMNEQTAVQLEKGKGVPMMQASFARRTAAAG